MKLHSHPTRGLSLELRLAERRLLTAVLAHFPAVPEDHHRLTARPVDPEDRLLAGAESLHRDALQAYQHELLGRVRTWRTHLEDEPNRRLFSWHLDPAEIEALLQVLNEVRVGAWIRLGCPDPLPTSPDEASGDSPRDHALMHFAGLLIAALVDQLEDRPGSA